MAARAGQIVVWESCHCLEALAVVAHVAAFALELITLEVLEADATHIIWSWLLEERVLV